MTDNDEPSWLRGVDYGPYRVHPLADAFPLIEGEEFALLVEDIKNNGLGTPIVLSPDQSTIVDGRNRYRACAEAMVDPVFHTLPASYSDEQIIDYIVSENLRRRHLNPGQLAFLALEVESQYAEIAKARQVAAAARDRTLPKSSRSDAEVPAVLREPSTKRRERESTQRAAKTTGASGRAVQQAKAVARDAPDLAAKVRADEMRLDAADRERKRRLAEQARRDPQPAKAKPGPVMLTLSTHDGQSVNYPQPQGKPHFNSTPGEGISWAGWSWNPVTGCLHGCGYCLTPDTPVLMADLTWRPIGELGLGDTMVGFDEESPRGVERRWRTATVEAAWRTTQAAYRVTLDDGREVVASAEHKWLCDRNSWRTTDTLRPGSRVRTAFPSAFIAHDEDYEAGYVAGMTLGDGTFRWDPSWRSDKLGYPQSYWRVAVLESDRAILDRLREYLAKAGVAVSVRPFQGGGDKPMAKVETRKLADMPIIDKLCRERPTDTWWAGWLAGMFDAEGSTSGGSLRISQKDVTVLAAAAEAAARLGFTFNVETASARLVGDRVEQARFLAVLRPTLARKAGLEGRKVRTSTATVVSVTRSVDVEMVDITTSTGTFVAEGLLTHNCYAREIAEAQRYASAYPVGFTPLFHHERLTAPANTPYPAGAAGTGQGRVFVCSMADLYGRWVPQEWIDAVHESERATPQWEYLHLTKFPDRYVGLDLPRSGWIGTSVDEQKRVRIAERAFSQIGDVAVKWLSLEPLLAPLEFTDLSMFDWVVIGAQTRTVQSSGVVEAFAPPFEWVARIVAQAREAGCKVHMKPNLMGHANPSSPGMQLLNEYPESED